MVVGRVVDVVVVRRVVVVVTRFAVLVDVPRPTEVDDVRPDALTEPDFPRGARANPRTTTRTATTPPTITTGRVRSPDDFFASAAAAAPVGGGLGAGDAAWYGRGPPLPGAVGALVVSGDGAAGSVDAPAATGSPHFGQSLSPATSAPQRLHAPTRILPEIRAAQRTVKRTSLAAPAPERSTGASCNPTLPVRKTPEVHHPSPRWNRGPGSSPPEGWLRPAVTTSVEGTGMWATASAAPPSGDELVVSRPSVPVADLIPVP